MVSESLVPILLQHWPAATFIVFTAYIVSNYFNHGLNKYPGPFIASLTDWWRFWDVYRRRPELTHIKLHEKHGNIVRLGPNTLSFSDPAALKMIYGLNKGFVKVRLHLKGRLVRLVRLMLMELERVLPSPTICSRRSPSSFSLLHD
jgi:hypothetical protein